MGLVIESMPDLGITRVSRWTFNCYVIHDTDGGPIVIDAGLPDTHDDLAPVLREHGGSLKAIVATHGHSDHVAGAPRLAERHGAAIHLPARTLAYFDNERPRTPTPAKVARIWPALLDQPFDPRGVVGLIRGARVAGFGTPAGMRWSGPAPTSALTDGQPLPGAPGWTVLAAAGHTDDSIALWNEATRTLISGDAVLSARGCVWHTPEVVDPEAACATAARLQQLPVAHLLPGHGRPVHADSVWANVRPAR
jgi:glyoxylase-like metal-dependent hydrolase (beta-lactamase superfamily II)